MSDTLGYVVWRKNSAKWEVLHSFPTDQLDRAHYTMQDLCGHEEAYDGPKDLAYEYGVSAVYA